jgi:hypothetical protein
MMSSYQQPFRDLLFGSTPGFFGRGILSMTLTSIKGDDDQSMSDFFE